MVARLDEGPEEPLMLASGNVLDGEWTRTFELLTDGGHTLHLRATDLAGNAAEEKSITIQRDTLAPEVAILGVTEGELLGTSVQPTFSVSDVNLASQSLMVDGKPFTVGMTVSTDGEHVLSAEATDKAGNTSRRQVRFVIDTKPPTVIIGVSSGAYVPRDFTPIIQVFDPHLEPLQATLNGQPYTPGTPVSGDGQYTLQVTARDTVGHESASTVTFTIDTLKPQISMVQDVLAGRSLKDPVTLKAEFSDANLVLTSETLNGQLYVGGSLIEAHGVYQYRAAAVDLAGNKSELTRTFTIDTHAPVIAVTGASEGGMLTAPATLAVSVQDDTPVTTTVTLNGQAVGTTVPVDQDGAYVLQVNATDAAGNQAQTAVSFFLDLLPPAISIEGVADGLEVDGPVRPLFGAKDTTPVTVTATLNGASFTSGTTLTEPGNYTLGVSATDGVGRTSQRSASFVIRPVVQHRARVLALVGAGHCAASAEEEARVRGFISSSLGSRDSLPQVVTDPKLFLREMRGGEYNVYVFFSLADSKPACSEAGDQSDDAPGDSADARVRKAWARAVTEQVHGGYAGFVAIRARPENLPALRNLLGVDFEGRTAESSVTFTASSPIAPLASLRTSRGTSRLKPVGQQTGLTLAANYGAGTGWTDVAGVLHTSGGGRSATFGFDVSGAQALADASKTMRRVVDWVAPATPPAPLAIRRGDLPLRAGNEGREVFAAGSLPPGSQPVSAVWLSGSPSAAVVLATDSELTHTVHASFAELEARLRREASALGRSEAELAVRRTIEAALDNVALRPAWSRTEALANLSDLLGAKAAVRGLGGDRVEMHSALDELIHYWEARCFLD